MGYGIEPDIALKGARHPRPDASDLGHRHPLLAAHHTTMQRRLKHNILRMDGVEETLLLAWDIHANEFLVESDGDGRLLAKTRHVGPLVLTDGLLNGMKIVARQLLQAHHGLIGGKGAIGVDAEFHLVLGESRTYDAQQFQLLIKVDSSNLQFDAAANIWSYEPIHTKPLVGMPTSPRAKGVSKRAVEPPAANWANAVSMPKSMEG